MFFFLVVCVNDSHRPSMEQRHLVAPERTKGWCKHLLVSGVTRLQQNTSRYQDMVSPGQWFQLLVAVL